MSFKDEISTKWEIMITGQDLNLAFPTKEELLDLITAALPEREIASQLVRLAAHLIKVIIYEHTTTSWEQTIEDAVTSIRMANTRRKCSGVYFSIKEMKHLLAAKWVPALSWVAGESKGEWSIPTLKEKITLNQIWETIKTYNVDQRFEISGSDI